ncbi:MAG: triacylglycerol lipase [Planctomycetota bacterium]|jgi:triacylglycerol lipase
MEDSTAVTESSGVRPKSKPMVRWFKRLVFASAALLVSFLIGVVSRGPVCWPFDFVWNLGPVVDAPELRVPDDGKVRVVFLQHGMWRTSMALDRIERTLRHQGYEVINTGYPSTSDYLAAHAKRLRDVVETRFARGRVDEISFVGHSMGGVVIHEYLRRTDSRQPKACVYIATPQRGAILADKRRNWFLFELAMGTKSARQLATVDPMHKLPILYGDRSGAIIGDIGAGNGDIPGHDDGTVGVSEARFDGISDTILVPYGHTSIVVRDEVLRQILHFLGRGAFAEPGKDG